MRYCEYHRILGYEGICYSQVSTKAIWLASKTSMTAEALSSHPPFTAKTVVADKKMVWEKKRHVRAISKKGRRKRHWHCWEVFASWAVERFRMPQKRQLFVRIFMICHWTWFLGHFQIGGLSNFGHPIQNGLSVWGETHGFGAPTVRKLQVIRFPPSMEEEDAIEARGQWAEDGRWFGFWKL